MVKKGKLIGVSELKNADYAIIVTAYEQTDQLGSVIDSLLKLDYSDYLIYVVADRCDIKALNIVDSRVIVLQPPTTLQSNVRSHFYAISNFQRQHHRLTIIDSDNLVAPDYIDQLNNYFNVGFKAVQGVRLPKNLNTIYARLDAARDIYYHYYDGKLLFELGSSATLAGSGMAFDTDLYIECLKPHTDLEGAGFDKVLQAEILKRDLRIAFAPKAIVYDQKTTSSTQLVNQRSRWIGTWFNYFKYGFGLIKAGIVRGSINQFLFGWVLIRPPLFIFLIVSSICALASLWIHPYHALIWLLAFALFISGFCIALIRSGADKSIFMSLQSIPKFIYYQVTAIFRLGKKNGNIATKHTTNIHTHL